MGATASGKSNFALSLSSYFPIEIISVDATSVYKGLDIGSAKPLKFEQELCPHHLVDIKSPVESYSVAQFLNDSIQLVSDINNRSKLPVFVGGTMMYYHALINGIHQLPSDQALRLQLKHDSDTKGLSYLYNQLKLLDPIAASSVSENDSHRILRKLEVCMLLNAPISEYLKLHQPITIADCNMLKICVMPEDKQELYKKSELRFDAMLNNGLVEEVASLITQYPSLNLNYSSIRSVGYKQVWQFLNHEITYAEMIEQAKTATRNLVKRQYTWLRNVDATTVTNESLLTVKQYIQEMLL
jgi:tRNA dimethylallyltransferase